jgi:hypothetical protein
MNDSLPLLNFQLIIQIQLNNPYNTKLLATIYNYIKQRSVLFLYVTK